MSDDDVHGERRRRLIEQLGPGVALVRGGSAAGLNPNFFYLTGLEEPRGALLMAPGGLRIGIGREYPGPDYQRGRIAHQVLFLPPVDPLAARWGEDATATLGSVAAEDAGVDAVLGTGELEPVLSRALGSCERLHLVRAASPALGAPFDGDGELLEAVRRGFLNVTVRDATPQVEELRRLKDPGEVQAIERAVVITGQAIRSVQELARPGMFEHELEAEIARVYRANGAVHGFDPIVATGRNATLLHYGRNNARVAEGDLILIDTGAQAGGYGADVTRTFPVDGHFSERQREVYETVLRAQQAAIELCRPGTLIGDIHAETYRVIDAAGFGECFMHGTSHHIGLETHDVGDVHRPLEPGAVITVEPGIYLEDEAIGVRIEDDVLITPEGHRVLSEAIPKQVEEIERG